ncbi:MAG: ROK family protein [Arachidicoccus sp.]|nr:ROK family protein [Arachidicoccus sp.]
MATKKAVKKAAPKKAVKIASEKFNTNKKIEKILSIDIGGTHIKTSVLNTDGKLLSEYKKLPTPLKATPNAVLKTIEELAKGLEFDVISAGFPGYVRNGIIHTAPNLGTEYWKGFEIEKELTKIFSKPARVVNDADMLGLGVMEGKGLEMVATLGTGFGTALFNEGKLLPHLELAHHPIIGAKDYDKVIGDKALKKLGKKKWNKNLEYILSIIKVVVNYDTLFLGGGNAEKINFKLDKNIKIVTNIEGIDGGAKLWKQ